MILKRFFILSVLLFVLSIVTYGQKFTRFSEDSDSFIGELETLFSKVSVKESKKKCELLMEHFSNNWEIGVFTKEIKQNTVNVCNLMLKRRMKPYPHFYQYLSSLNGLMDYDHSVGSYLAWHKSVDSLVKEKRSSKPFTSFVNTSYNLLNDNILYTSKATTWKASTYDFYFNFDSVPEVVFKDKMTLTCYANKDSSLIYETKGVYFPLRNTWEGRNGKVNWNRAGFSSDEVYAVFSDYSIYLGFSRYVVDSVSFYHKGYWKKPLLGQFSEKVLANVQPEKASYPRFKSYFAFVTIKSLFEGIDYGGGIEMRGSKLIGASTLESDAILTVAKGDNEFMRIKSKTFVIRPEKISSSLASVTVYFKEDSIYHPGLKVSYIDETRELSLVRSGEGTSKSPFFDSFHNLDIHAEAIYWQMDSKTLNIEAIKGVSGLGKANFESSNYFSEPRYERLQGIDMINPLITIKRYAEKYGLTEVHVQGLSEYMMMPETQVIGLLVKLSNQGFVIYNRDEKKAYIKEKLFDYIDASNRKIDYDVIQFSSETYGFQNASMELDSFGLRLYGVPLVIMSDSQNVFIFPENQELVIKEGMDFSFSGRVHAGLFDFYARKCDFSYDQFMFKMEAIDSMSFKVRSFEKDENGKRPLVKVKNVVADLGGELMIDAPNNKSGLKDYPEFPIFTSTKDAYVYYNYPAIYNGVYAKDKFFFYVYPFTIDSLDNFKTEILEFEGYLASAGIFPDMENALKVQPDYSLGFTAKTPPEGYAVYGGKGNFFSDINLSNKGLRGDGSLQYLTSTSWSKEYLFFPDSCNALADNFVLTEQFTPIEYPSAKGINVDIHWEPYMDFMKIKETEFPITMFGDQSQLSGVLVLTPEELKGAGLMSFEDAEMSSKLFKFKQHEIFADSADFNLTSEEFITSAFSTHNYKSHIDFNERKGEFVSNGGASMVDFPVNQYICSIDEFKWFMDSYEIAIGSSEKEAEMAQYNDLTIRELVDVPLQGSEFISTHPDQDSLRFISTIATYNLKDYIINANDVKFIRVADAAVFPVDRMVKIERNAQLDPMEHAKILANTVTKYHEIYDGTVDIRGRKDYSAVGNYDYMDETGYRQKILLKNIGVDPIYQTTGKGSVSDTTGFSISIDFDFSGDITLKASDQFLLFDGGFRIRHTCSSGKRDWVKFRSNVDPKDIYLDIEKDLKNIHGDKLMSGLMFSQESNRFYAGFLSPKRSNSDQEIISADGFIRFDKDEEIYHVSTLGYLKGTSLEGNHISLGRQKCILSCDGKFDLGVDLGMVELQTTGAAKHYIIPDSTSFQLVMGIDFPFEDKAMDLLVESISGKNLQGVRLNTPFFTKALADILGEKKSEKSIGDLRLLGKFRKYPTELQHTILFSDLRFKWNPATRSYVSVGQLGIGSVGKKQINRYVKGYVEIARKRTGDVVNIYIEFEKGRYWFYFNYRNNLMQAISSNSEFNTILREMKEEKRKVKDGKEGEEYSFGISNLRKKTDFLRRVKSLY